MFLLGTRIILCSASDLASRFTPPSHLSLSDARRNELIKPSAVSYSTGTDELSARVVSSFFRPVSHKVISCSDLLPPLSPSLRSGGFLFDSLYRLSISRLSPRAPRFIFLPGYGLFSFISLWYFSIVLHQDASRSPFRSLRPSSRIFTAAFTSRSMQFPHPH